MAAGKINLQANDGAVIGLVVPDGLTSGERQMSLGANLSGITAYHLLQGNLAVSNSTITQGFNTTLYTGNGTTQAVNTGIDMSTQWGSTAEEKFGGLVWIKDKNRADSHILSDTIRGTGYFVQTSTTNAELTLGTSGITSFNSNGFSVGSHTAVNTTDGGANNIASWNFQTTHRISGTTNHGKPYTCHYNPFTGFTIVKYEGSGIVGHEIPHHLGRKLGFVTIKNLSAAIDWLTYYGTDNMYMAQNLTIAGTFDSGVWSNQTDTAFRVGGGPQFNQASSQHVMYGWANSYYDESNKLIGNYELVTYQGTGVAGNKITTRGKPAWVMVKRTDSTGNWYIVDNQRGLTSGNSNFLIANTAAIEASNSTLIEIFNPDGFTHNGTSIEVNTSGGQYIALVAYDTNANGGGSYYPLTSDTANVQINNALIPLAQGIDGNGVKNTILSKNETITGLTYTQGKNYVYCDKNGTYGVKPHRPRYLSTDLVRTYAGENPDYYDVKSNKWFNCDAGAELIANGTGLSLTGWVAKDVNSGYPDSALSLSNQTIVITNSSTAGSNGAAYQLLTGLTIGKKYKVKLSQDGTVIVQVGIASHLASARYTASSIGATEFEFIAQATSVYLTFYNSVSTANDSCWIDNVTCFQTDIVPTTEIPEGRNYLNHIVYADNDGGVLYVEELPKTQYFDRVETGNNRKVMYLADYGIAQIQNNKRYVLDNPFGNDRYMDCDAKLEILTTDGYWVELSHSQSQNGSGAAYSGAKAFSTQVGIVIQTALDGFTFNPANCHIVPFTVTNTTLAQARVTIQFNGRTGRTI